MLRKQYLAGLDIGGFSVRTVVVEDSGVHDELPKVIGVGEAPSFGLRRGAVVDIEELSRSIGASVAKAESMAGLSISKVAVNIGGQNIRTQVSKGVVAVGRADSEVTQGDVDRVMAAAGDVNIPVNNEVIHILPRSYRLDDQTGIKNPVGMKGVRLEVEALVVEGFTPQIKNLLTALQFSNLELQQMVFSPIAAAESILDRKQRELGVVLLDIGASGTGMAVYEEGDLLHTAIIPVGASHVTNDVAIGIRTSIETAEKVKLMYGTACPDDIDKKEELDLSTVNSAESGEIYLHHVAEIIEARMEEIFDTANGELKRMGRDGLLPAGVVLVGAGAKLPGVTDLAKQILRLPVTIGYPREFGGLLDKIDDPGCAVVTGLVQWQKSQSVYSNENIFGRMGMSGKLKGVAVTKIRDWFGRFLP